MEKSRNDAWNSKVPTSVTWTFGANEKVMLGLTDRIYTDSGVLVDATQIVDEHAEYFLTPGEYEVFLNVACEPILLVQE